MKLTSENVNKIFMNCLFNSGENTDNAIMVDGIINNFGFHPDRIKQHKDDIYSMLKELPEKFHKGAGGGWSFVGACMDKNGSQWGEHQNMEQLFTLGIACGKAKYSLPKNLWELLPGGMPYCTVL